MGYHLGEDVFREAISSSSAFPPSAWSERAVWGRWLTAELKRVSFPRCPVWPRREGRTGLQPNKAMLWRWVHTRFFEFKALWAHLSSSSHWGGGGGGGGSLQYWSPDWKRHSSSWSTVSGEVRKWLSQSINPTQLSLQEWPLFLMLMTQEPSGARGSLLRLRGLYTRTAPLALWSLVWDI